MRLIDVDELKQYIGDCKCCDKCPNKGRKQYECYYDCKFPDYLTEEWERVLDEQPTVDAIPIEWISNKAKSYEHSDNSILQDGAFLLNILIDDWKEEQEKQNEIG